MFVHQSRIKAKLGANKSTTLANFVAYCLLSESYQVPVYITLRLDHKSTHCCFVRCVSLIVKLGVTRCNWIPYMIFRQISGNLRVSGLMSVTIPNTQTVWTESTALLLVILGMDKTYYFYIFFISDVCEVAVSIFCSSFYFFYTWHLVVNPFSFLSVSISSDTHSSKTRIKMLKFSAFIYFI